ncbi:thioesterase family protein [Treponema sp. OMZ 787]|uniref:thioesterase family protein n=1 Tax=Treponema sp. OMZ 787 TaxID=2563669 RepID=UPI0020A48657|nr:thioesterase family protein [Treponema sp. OMZ 787]UTC61665.1 thioesterase family protein [Treponema sp. OMZ 787]
MLKTGINGKEEIIVNENHSAESLESGTLKVFGTPAMIALMEKTAWKSVQDYLEEGQGTVGTSLEIKHVSATPLGMKVYCESELTGIDGKKLIFSVKAYDETGLIGEGIHERFIVNNEKFQKKTNQKMK